MAAAVRFEGGLCGRWGGCMGVANVLAGKLPCELVRLIEEHGGAMVLQRAARRQRGKRLRAAARRRHMAEWNEHVARYLGSFALGNVPMASPLDAWSREELAWRERYDRRAIRRLAAGQGR